MVASRYNDYVRLNAAVKALSSIAELAPAWIEQLSDEARAVLLLVKKGVRMCTILMLLDAVEKMDKALLAKLFPVILFWIEAMEEQFGKQLGKMDADNVMQAVIAYMSGAELTEVFLMASLERLVNGQVLKAWDPEFYQELLNDRDEQVA